MYRDGGTSSNTAGGLFQRLAEKRLLIAFMVSLSNHEGLARAFVWRFMVRPGKTRSVCLCSP